MRTYFESTHPKLVVRRKLAIIRELVIVTTSHTQQSGKKQFAPSGCAITSYFGATNPYKFFDDA